MVVPSALADTVTPPSFSPDAEVTVPLSSWSAACAGVARLIAATLAATSAGTPNRYAFMAFLLVFVRSIRLASGGGGHRLEIGDDRVDLAALEIVLEGGHARRAVADDAADDVVVAAGGVLGERRTEGPRVDLRRQVAHAAGLGEDPPAGRLRLVEGVVGGGLLRRRGQRPRREREHQGRGAARHHRILPTLHFFQSVCRRGAGRKAIT